MNVHAEHHLRDTQTGFTLVELVIVIVVLGIMSVYAMMKGASPAEMSVPSQAQKLASDIRHAQTLAYTSGNRMRLTITAGANGTYGVDLNRNFDELLASLIRFWLSLNFG